MRWSEESPGADPGDSSARDEELARSARTEAAESVSTSEEPLTSEAEESPGPGGTSTAESLGNAEQPTAAESPVVEERPVPTWTPLYVQMLVGQWRELSRPSGWSGFDEGTLDPRIVRVTRTDSGSTLRLEVLAVGETSAPLGENKTLLVHVQLAPLALDLPTLPG